MHYKNIEKAKFIDRPNRFIANVEIDGKPVVCHVKNTGRCRELLVPGAEILVQKSTNTKRRTAYDLISVYKNGRLINMDSYAPNIVFGEFLRSGGLGEVPSLIKPECRHGDSRFDFYFELSGRQCFAEVKGVTLEDEGTVRFPDAPTERGVKHLNGLIQCVEEGYDAYAVFIIQMDKVSHFEPNSATDPLFADALKNAHKAGVKLLALSCRVTENTLSAADAVPIQLD